MVNKIKSMQVKNIIDEPIKTGKKYHVGYSAAIKTKGISVIITAKSISELQRIFKQLFSECFSLDESLIVRVALFGVDND